MRSLALYGRNNNKGMLGINNMAIESESPIYVNENLKSQNNIMQFQNIKERKGLLVHYAVL